LTEVFDHNPEAPDDPKAVSIWYLGLVGALLLVVIVLGVTALYANVKAGVFDAQVVRQRFTEVQDLPQAQEALLAGGTVEVEVQGETIRKNTMPITEAMQRVVAEANTGD
jgi:vancomycin permeability regulator SanA